MTSPIKFASTPPTEYRNGLLEILDRLIAAPGEQRVVLAVVDVRRVEEDVDAEKKVPTIRFLRIELPLELDRKAAWDMLQRATDARVRDDDGTQPLPFHDDED